MGSGSRFLAMVVAGGPTIRFWVRVGVPMWMEDAGSGAIRVGIGYQTILGGGPHFTMDVGALPQASDGSGYPTPSGVHRGSVGGERAAMLAGRRSLPGLHGMEVDGTTMAGAWALSLILVLAPRPLFFFRGDACVIRALPILPRVTIIHMRSTVSPAWRTQRSLGTTIPLSSKAPVAHKLPSPAARRFLTRPSGKGPGAHGVLRAFVSNCRSRRAGLWSTALGLRMCPPPRPPHFEGPAERCLLQGVEAQPPHPLGRSAHPTRVRPFCRKPLQTPVRFEEVSRAVVLGGAL